MERNDFSDSAFFIFLLFRATEMLRLLFLLYFLQSGYIRVFLSVLTFFTVTWILFVIDNSLIGGLQGMYMYFDFLTIHLWLYRYIVVLALSERVRRKYLIYLAVMWALGNAFQSWRARTLMLLLVHEICQFMSQRDRRTDSVSQIFALWALSDTATTMVKRLKLLISSLPELAYIMYIFS